MELLMMFLLIAIWGTIVAVMHWSIWASILGGAVIGWFWPRIFRKL